ncbi:hypothetical protein P280DRAFT_115505 [Massarina eburnea CBS 473.64]|uniref:Hamartin n=1 Tax=Massarina eburnea CBS 473.64 TaxID=1395130 RepID=A0A6A6SBV2_9PLEO|nr:hypothetical protein P280DRAFT_115505 [Massarina eburnea CBS 473.64]
MASGTMRETLKGLQDIFAAPSAPYPLPDGIKETIDNFLERYSNIDDGDSQRFHDELQALYTRQVADSPEKGATFLQALKAVRPALTGETRWKDWWNLVLKPTIDSVGHKRNEVEGAKELVLGILLFDADEDKDGDLARLSTFFMKGLFDIYLSRTRIPSATEDIASPQDDYIAQEVESVLVAFGRRKPKELLAAIDDLFVQKECRIQALLLLNAFVRLQTPHLHLVLETSLIQHLEKCLLIDTSSTVVSQALMILIMFLPHITAALTSDHHLPKLFLIYSRILCWDKFGSEETTDREAASEDESDDGAEEEEDAEPAWEKLEQSSDYSDASPPTLLHYYTFLYGLFPLNFMSFIRKPRKFLKTLNFPGADDFDLDQDLIQRRTEPYRRVHLLHPNMFTTIIEDELTENRWLKSDPADVVMECMELCVAVSTALNDPGPPPTSKLPDLPLPPIPDIPLDQLSLDDEATIADSTASWRNTQSTMFASSTNEHQDMSESLEIPSSAKSLKSASSVSPLLKCKDVIESPTLPPMKEATHKKNFLGAPMAMPQRLVVNSPTISNFSNVVAGSPTHSEFQSQSMAALQREIMLLRNDLNFERYMKSQHVAHLGQLQRTHIKEATAEADTQNLINTNKTLRARLAKMNEQYAQLKKETLTSRSQSKKWEGELSGKVRSYKDDQKTWQGNEESLRFELKKTQTDCEHLKKIVEKAEAEQLRAQQRTQALEFELHDYEGMRRNLEYAQETIEEYENQTKDFGLSMQQRNDLQNELESASLRLNSLELERQRIIKAYERRIMELESQLQGAQKTVARPGQLPSSVQQMLDSALAANNAKLASIKKMYHRVQDQRTELEMQYHELQGEHQATLGRLRDYERDEHPQQPDRDALSRNFSLRHSYADNKFAHPVLSDIDTSTDAYGYPEYQSPVVSPTNTTAPPLRPIRQESLPIHRTQRLQRDPNSGYAQDYPPSAYDAPPFDPSQFQLPRPSETVISSGKSGYSVDTTSSKGERREKDKVAAKSEVRVYGRGGAQNIGSKKKEKEGKEKEKESKRTGGFRGLKGIM